MKPRDHRKRVLKVGDKVFVAFGTTKVEAVVVEDRGALGAGGKKILRVRLLKVEPESEFEVRAEDLQPTAP